MTMEFEQLQKIWDAQNDQPLYTINEKAMYNIILSKKKQARHITNTSELLLIFVNLASGIFTVIVNYFKQGNIFLYLLSAWMFGSALFTLFSRIKRKKGEDQFDRSMHGDLNHAISVATYQVYISRIMRWNIIPIAVLCLLGLWDGGKPVWIVVTVLIFFSLVFYGGGWEHNIYKRKKRELEILKGKLENEA